MDPQDIASIVRRQRAFFATGATLDVDYRLDALRRLRSWVRENEGHIDQALEQDLGKSAFESYMCEVGLVLSEASFMLRHARGYARERRVKTPLANFSARSFVKPGPYGTVLVMSPWNYPFLLTVEPLIDAIAAGNTAVLKPSAYAPATSMVIQAMVEELFSLEYVAVVTGGRAENSALLDEPFDYIFFTGSTAVGREVLCHAAERLTPVTLELGGKSPCIVHSDADVALAARRVVFGKYLNCGQTCVAPDYVLCHESVKNAFIEAVVSEVKRQYGEKPLENPAYGCIMNEKHLRRLSGLIDPAKVVFGGTVRAETLQVEPTVMDGVTLDDAVMGEEIFGPILPMLTYGELDEALMMVEKHPTPLALYVFTASKDVAEAALSRVRFGGGCVNDVVIHLATSEMGFGGVGASGMGAYHGKAGFEAFSHTKSVVDKKTWVDLPIRYQPYGSAKERLLRMFLR